MEGRCVINCLLCVIIWVNRLKVLRRHLPEHGAARGPIWARTDALRHHLPACWIPYVAVSGRCVVIWLIVRQHLLSRWSARKMMTHSLDRNFLIFKAAGKTAASFA
jgi:hypothetical protein